MHNLENIPIDLHYLPLQWDFNLINCLLLILLLILLN